MVLCARGSNRTPPAAGSLCAVLWQRGCRGKKSGPLEIKISGALCSDDSDSNLTREKYKKNHGKTVLIDIEL